MKQQNKTLKVAALSSLALLINQSAMISNAQAAEAMSKASVSEITKPVVACGDLKNVDLTAIGGAGSQVTSAKETLIGEQMMCVVEGNLAPTIGFKVKLPVNNWHARYLQIGCGGLCGSMPEEIGAASGCDALENGEFTSATTDMGHQGNVDFGRDPQKRADFAYRSLHLTSETAKTMIKAYYGKTQAFSYFTGCSDGGREALIEAQRYPTDFDGIIAGAPAMNFEVQNGIYHPYLTQSNTGKDGKPIVLANRVALIHKAVLDQCDALDGQKDGLIADPLSCHFNPKVLQCKAGATDTSSCLTAEETEAVRRFYAGPTDPKTGKRMIAGGPLPGSELAWAGVFVPQHHDDMIFSQIISQGARNVLFKDIPDDSKFSFTTMKFDHALFNQLKEMHSFYDSTNPDLTKFYKHGGKLILWHGWADQHISPVNTIEYHKAVQKFMGEKVAKQFERLYLIPGMNHCQGGEGPNLIDLLSPMMAWVEHGHAPEAVIAKKAKVEVNSAFGQPTNDKSATDKKEPPKPVMQKASQMIIEESRPVYPYPYMAAYKGKGDPTVAESYHPVKLKSADLKVDWLGNDLYKPYQLIH